MTTPPPKWISPFFYCALIAALAVIGLILLSHHAQGPAIGDHNVADMTFTLGGEPVREHCTTCHINGARPNPADLGQTVKPHPDISPHRIDQLGCSACHLGEGMALDLEISHGLPGLGARRVLSGKDLQASCFRCHKPAPLAGAENAWNGYRLFFAKACNTCHAVSGLSLTGYYGPDLSRIGSVLGLDQIQDAILEPRKDPINSNMPRFPLSKSQARQISYFLKSLTGEVLYATPMQIRSGVFKPTLVDLRPQRLDLSDGESLLHQQQCLACHKFRQDDGRIGPDLTYIGTQRESDYLKGFLNNPTRLIPGSAMPRIPMEATTELQLLQFLQSSAIGPVGSHDGTHGEKSNHQKSALPTLSSKQLYMQLCQRCHAAEGDGHGPIEPNLANFPRAFSNNADFFRSVSDQRLLESLRQGVPGTSMPSYGKLLGHAQVNQLLELVFSAFINLDRQDKRLTDLPPERPAALLSQQQSQNLYVENCQRCHGIFGTGKGPEALNHLPHPRNLRNQPYFAALDDSRIARAIHDGIPGTAMPAFGERLDARALWSMVSKIRELSHAEE